MDNLSPRDPAVRIPKETRATLLNVALTCHSFLGPALDALWYSIEDLTVLFKLLPNFMASDGTKPGIIWDNILEADIRTFDSYAFRVRSYIQRRLSNIDILAFLEIIKACNRSHLLPNLQYLAPDLSELDNRELIFLTSPRLRVFKHSRWDGDSSTSPKTLLDAFRKSSPDLSVLALEPVAFDALSLSALSALKRLKELTIYHTHTSQTVVDVEFLLNISSRITLRRLSLRGGLLKIAPLSTSLIVPSSISFPALEDITFDCDLTMASLTTFLHAATFPVLERWVIWPRGQMSDEADHWHRFFDCIGNVTTNRFKELHLHHIETTRIASGSNFPRLHHLSSLSLTVFSLDTSVFGPLHRNDIITIINTWPLLVDLQLSSENVPNIEFSILFDIAMGLQRLRELGLSINVYLLPNLHDIPILSHKLKVLKLKLFNSRTEQVWDVAQSIDRLFPHLGHFSIVLRSPGSYTDYQHWSKAEDLIFVLQEARKAESIRIGNKILGSTKLLEQ